MSLGFLKVRNTLKDERLSELLRESGRKVWNWRPSLVRNYDSDSDDVYLKVPL